MMRNTIFPLLATMMLVAAVFTSCSDDKDDSFRNTIAEEKLKTFGDVGFYEGENARLLFKGTEHQLYLKKSSSGNLFRILSDDASKYAEVTLEGNAKYLPEDIIKVTVKDTGFEKINNHTLNMIVIQKQIDKLWLLEYGKSEKPFGAIIYWQE